MKLILLRHSIRDDVDNPDKYSGYNNNCPLSLSGVELCHLKASKLQYPPTQIISSPFLRTIQTANVYKMYFPKSSFAIDCLVSEGQNCHRPSFEPELLREMDLAGIKYPESIEDITSRCQKFLFKLINTGSIDDVYLVSTHGIIYNTILKLIFPKYTFKSTGSPSEYVPKFCDTSVLEYNGESNDQWRVLETDIKFLEIFQITNNVLNFWFPSPGFHKFWFDKSVDDLILSNYSDLPDKALTWTPEDEDNDVIFEHHVAKIIILDQFIRNLNRDGHIDATKYNDEGLQSSLRFLEKIKKSPDTIITTQMLVFGLIPLRHSRKAEYLDMLISFCDAPTVNIDDPELWKRFQWANKKELKN